MTGGLELGDLYGATIERIEAQDGNQSRLGMAALTWISHAERPLQADELCHALAVELNATDFKADNIPSVSNLVGCCQGLITIDKEASTIRLVHFTLQEYLSAHPDIFSRPHSTIAEIYLTYLNSHQVKTVSTTSSNTRNTPFLEYCSVYWGVHAKRELSGSARSLALELLKEDYGQTSTRLLLKPTLYLPLRDSDPCSPFSGLHFASFFGVAEVVVDLIEMGCYDINEGDFSGHTPLAWAALRGYEVLVEVLLGRQGVNPDKPDNFGQTPLNRAASFGHKGVVKILLEREEVNPDQPDYWGKTPRSLISTHYGKEVAALLQSRKVVASSTI